MFRPDGGLGGGGDTGLDHAKQDMVLNSFNALLLLFVLALAFVQIQKVTAEGKEETAPGNVQVELIWDPKRAIDLDLWVQAPGDKPVGYSAKSGKVFDLLRDDLGHQTDLGEANVENAYTRGIPKAAGEYVVNVHAFRMDGQGPVEATVIVRSKENADAPVREIVATKLSLQGDGQELTSFRFKLTEKGELVEGSVHNIFKPLRSQQSQGAGGSPSGDPYGSSDE